MNHVRSMRDDGYRPPRELRSQKEAHIKARALTLDILNNGYRRATGVFEEEEKRNV